MKKKINVYRVVRDDAYEKLEPVDEEAFNEERTRSWAFDGSSPENWVELELQPTQTGLKQPDIWAIVPGIIALEHKAYYELCSSAEETQQGRMYFGYCEGRRMAIVNSTNCIDALLAHESEFERSDTSKIRSYVFDGSKLDISLFKIPQTKEYELYTLDGFDEENDFKTLVEKFGFTGVKFEHLWSGDSWMDA